MSCIDGGRSLRKIRALVQLPHGPKTLRILDVEGLLMELQQIAQWGLWG
jgi:hypothetical protein